MTERARNRTSAEDIVSNVRMQLDAFAKGEVNAETLGPALSALGGAASDSSWEILALLDQYYRRGQLPLDLFRALKARINRIALTGTGREGNAAAFSASDGHDATGELPSPITQASELSPPLSDRARDSFATGPVAEPLLAPGRLLKDRYLIEGVLGRGGMSTVYRAIDRHRADLPERSQYVAVKVLNPKFGQRPDAVAAFRNEFYHVQRLSHPGIVNVFDLDEDGPTQFFTMEFLDGETLSRVMERIRPRVLERSQALAVLREIGLALSYAHERGVVHGDLKPHNIMLTQPGEVRVLDFGAAGRLALREPWIAEDAERGFRTATPAYTSCERLEGAAPGGPDDLFSLSCLAYELLSGTHPFQYLAATDARKRKLRPARVAGLTNRQWKTLSAALAWERDGSMSVREWLAGLELERASPRPPPLGQLETQPQKPASMTRTILLTVLALSIALAAYVWRQDLSAVAGPSLQSLQSVLGEFTASLRSRPTPVSAPPAAATGGADTEPSTPAPVPAPFVPVTMPAETVDTAAGQVAVAATPIRQPGPGRISFARDTYVVSPSDGAARILLRRSGGSTGTVGFTWWTEEGTARQGKDYISFGHRGEQLQSGETQIAVFVPVVSDPLRRHSEIFYVALGDTTDGLTTGAITRATVVIDRAQESAGP